MRKEKQARAEDETVEIKVVFLNCTVHLAVMHSFNSSSPSRIPTQAVVWGFRCGRVAKPL